FPHQKIRIAPSYPPPNLAAITQTRTNLRRSLFFEVPLCNNGADAGIPAVQSSCPRWAADNQGPTAPRNGNMTHPTRRMKFNPGRSSLQLLSVDISKFSH